MPKILIVDDSQPILESLRLLLTHRGYEVHVAIDGREGIALAREHAFDGALVDVQMPGLDGFAVCRALRKQAADAGHSLSIWIITGGTAPELPQRARDAGALAVLGKPFDLGDIFRRLDEQFGRVPALAQRVAS